MPNANIDVKEQFISILVEELSWDRGEISLNSSFEDLGCDSLDFVEVILTCEDVFEVEISDEDAEACKTVSDAVTLLTRLLAAKGDSKCGN